jgi:hypothetical protein
MADTTYKAFPLILRSKGIQAKFAPDQPPDQTFWLNLNGALERAETAMSSRYGTIILNRDPAVSPSVGTNNYLLPFAPITLARLLVGSPPTSYRYAALSDGSLYRRATDIQGQYSQVLPPASLSGQPFTPIVNNSFNSSQPFLYIYDRLAMFKDSGIGTPTRLGVLPPVRPATTQNYAPNITLINVFNSTASYTTSGSLTISSSSANVFSIAGTGGSPQLGGNYERYTGSGSYFAPPDGMLAASVSLPDGSWRLKFQTNIIAGQFDVFASNSAYATADTFNFPDTVTAVAANATGTIGKTLSPTMDLSVFDPADLIVIVLQVSATQNVQEIRIQFDVNSSAFTTSYYTATLIPISYQGYLSNPQTSTATTSANNQTFQQSILASRGAGMGSVVRRYGLRTPGMSEAMGDGGFLPDIDGGGGGGTGGGGGDGNVGTTQLPTAGAWAAIYLQKGDFLPVGSAGQQGLDWSNITGWRIQVTTNSGGSSNVSFNSLYIQGGGVTSSPAVMASGPSSYGGVGYDIRYRYFNANTGTPSNGSPPQFFSVTSVNPGGVSTLFPLRQGINVIGQYSSDPQTTHIQVFVRGGLFGNNWYYADEFPNVTGTSNFSYKYSLPDSVLASGDILNLANDVPVTATLPQPINTTLTNAGGVGPSPVNTNTPTLVTITVADPTIQFTPNQIVFIGQPSNLEEVAVVTGSTGSFTCWIQSFHSPNEQVQAFSIPAVPLYLAAIAYGKVWMAGDPSNPHYLYFTNPGFPENAGPQNYIPVGTPSDPIVAVIQTRGVLFVETRSTWYQIYPGNPPYAQSTGSKHGSPASFGWAIGENEIWAQAMDGIRTFRGTDGPYRSLIIEWLYRNVPLTPVPLVDLNLLSTVIAAYRDNTATFIYTGVDGNLHRLHFDTMFQRWRNDDVPVTAIYLETDTNNLVYSKLMTIGSPPVSGYAIIQDAYQDFDDGGWVDGQLVELPIPVTAQTSYSDQKAPNNQKQYNVLTIDANPGGQTITPVLLFDDNNGSVLPVTPTPSTFTGAIRNKFQFQINAGQGQQAYRVSLQLSWSSTIAPEIYQADIYAAMLTDVRSSLDSYWIKFGTDGFKITKQIYIDYTSTAVITVSLYADGDLSAPFYTFTLPASPLRVGSPVRVRFGNILGVGSRMLRMLRLIATSTAPFQLWSPLQIDVKPVGTQGKGYAMTPIGGLTPP